MNTAASIITYNPDIDQLLLNLNALCKQVDLVLVFDNNSNNSDSVRTICQNYSNCEAIFNKENLGISLNLNRALDICNTRGIDWLLTLDQDSICQDNLVEIYKNKINSNANIVSVTPYILDRNLGNSEAGNEDVIVNSCITSGNMINVGFCLKIGGFDERFFIDCVDFDLCASIELSGGTIIKAANAFLSHSVGFAKKHKFFGKQLISYNHSPMRSYYIVRNGCLFKNKYRNNKNIKRVEHPFLKQLLLVILYEKEKFKKIGYCFSGFADYLRKRFGKKNNK